MSNHNNIKFTYKRKVDKTYGDFQNPKRIKILNETGNAILQENEITSNENTSTPISTLKKNKNSNDILSYFNKRIPSKKTKEVKTESLEKKAPTKGFKTLDSYFQIKSTDDYKNDIMNPREKETCENHDKKVILAKKKYEQLHFGLETKSTKSTVCSECGMPYNPCSQEGQLQHQNYHNIIIDGIEYSGYKTDKIINSISKDEYISKVVMSVTTPSHKKKLYQILNLIQTELGAVPLQENFVENSSFYIYIKNKKLVGCAIVREVKEAFKIEINKNIKDISTIQKINKNQASKVPTLCGISRIWVSKKKRKKGIASQLLESIRNHFLFNMTLQRHQIAFSQPTELGTKLAYHFFNYTNDDEDNDILMIPPQPFIIIYMDDDN